MPGDAATRFMREVQEFERTGDAEPLVALFAADAELSSPVKEPRRGPDGAREFWRTYRGAFGEVRSTFTHVVEAGDEVVLEWTGEGLLPGGTPIRYEGVSLLELKGGRVRRFRTYYDSAAFVEAKPLSTA